MDVVCKAIGPAGIRSSTYNRDPKYPKYKNIGARYVRSSINIIKITLTTPDDRVRKMKTERKRPEALQETHNVKT